MFVFPVQTALHDAITYELEGDCLWASENSSHERLQMAFHGLHILQVPCRNLHLPIIMSGKEMTMSRADDDHRCYVLLSHTVHVSIHHYISHSFTPCFANYLQKYKCKQIYLIDPEVSSHWLQWLEIAIPPSSELV